MEKIQHASLAQRDPLATPTIRSQDINKAAEQFEAIFLRNLMKQMRETNAVFESKDDPMNSESGRMMQSLYDDTLCTQMAHQHGIGLATLIVKQLTHHA
ncbi:rod-binding protein [Siccibacter turicensis]|uniref:rod-binding protein n=1 Tax=Siccibacter turicensis TaxID=357233 RepID=UPI0023F3673A|nr:rod-binding protein [Siccibacter turicensis]